MIELSINNLTKYYGATKIFENISFEVKTRERIGLIGKNGCGKTTVMKIIMGRYLGGIPGVNKLEEDGLNTDGSLTEDYQGGEVNLRKDVKVGYLNQIPVYKEGVKAIDVIRMALQEVFLLQSKLSELENQFQFLSDDALDKALKQYTRLTEEYEQAGGYELETKINKITDGLKIDSGMKEMSFASLSGGEKTRVILAKILLEEPDILLLDEPTNHLDLETTEWLEGFLKSYNGSVLMISHDRYFLDSVAGKIVELEFNRTGIYYGNYSYYVLEKERRFLIEYKHYLSQQKKIEQMEQQIEQYRIWGRMRDSEAMFKRAKVLEKRLEKIEVLDKPVKTSKRVQFNQDIGSRTGNMVLDIGNLSKGFEENPLLIDVEFTLFYQDSACIIGKNGCGKTTLLKMILGELQPDTGTIKTGSQVKIGYLPQQVTFQDEEQTILEYFTYHHNITYEAARSQLARGLFFKEDVHKKIRILSGGEKSRLRLCSLTFEKVNLMVLDEPTNHLDIESREVLEKTLAEYEGTLLFVSHDRYFINKIADKIMVIENSNLKVYPGDYSYYLEECRKNTSEVFQPGNKTEEAAKPEGISKTAAGRTESTDKPTGSYKRSEAEKTIELSKASGANKAANYKTDASRKRSAAISPWKLEMLEREIEEMETELKAIETEIAEHSFEAEYLGELFLKKEKVENRLNMAYDSWENYQLADEK